VCRDGIAGSGKSFAGYEVAGGVGFQNTALGTDIESCLCDSTNM
jgi:hypothetical protein